MLLRPLSSDSLLPDSDSLSAPIAKNPGSSGTITGIPGHAVVLKLVRMTRLKPTVASSARRPKSIATLSAADVALGKRGDGPMARTVAGGRASTTYRVAVPSLPFFFARVAFVCALLIAASGRRRPEGSERLKPAVSHGDIGKDATPRSKCRKWGRRSQLGRGTSVRPGGSVSTPLLTPRHWIQVRIFRARGAGENVIRIFMPLTILYHMSRRPLGEDHMPFTVCREG